MQTKATVRPLRHLDQTSDMLMALPLKSLEI